MKKVLIVFAIIVVIGASAYSIYKENNPYNYKIIENYRRLGVDYSKKGYYILSSSSETNELYYYIICMGEDKYKGYNLKVQSIEFDYYGNAFVTVEELLPKSDDLVALTYNYPTVCIETNELFKSITIKNTEGVEYELLN